MKIEYCRFLGRTKLKLFFYVTKKLTCISVIFLQKELTFCFSEGNGAKDNEDNEDDDDLEDGTKTHSGVLESDFAAV